MRKLSPKSQALNTQSCPDPKCCNKRTPSAPINRYRAIWDAAAATAKLLQSCPTLWSHIRQPPRLHRPWDSPGKNTGVGCHFLPHCMKVKLLSRVQPSATPWTSAYQALLHPWDFPGKSTGVGCHCLLRQYGMDKYSENSEEQQLIKDLSS